MYQDSEIIIRQGDTGRLHHPGGAGQCRESEPQEMRLALQEPGFFGEMAL
jgi:hypothetical protein